MQPTTSPPPTGPRPPRGAWPWAVGAVLVAVATAVAVAVPLVRASFAAAETERVEALVGRTDVLEGRLVRADGGLALPVTSGLYEVQVPAAAPVPEAGGPAQVRTALRAGLHDADDFPERVQVLVVYESRTTPDGLSLGSVHALDHALPGEPLAPVGPAAVTDAQAAVAASHRAAVVAGAVGTLVTVLLVGLAVRGSRRRRAWLGALPRPSTG
ncbi:hypothetical protein GCM10028777_09850 [Angustibacter speluncae]